MQFVVKMLDGMVYESDVRDSEVSLQEDFGGDKCAFEQAMAEARDMLKHIKDMNYLSLEMDGEKVIFNPANIVWIKAYGIGLEDE